MLPGDLLANNARGWRGRKKKYDLCRLRLWDSCRCILCTALREYNRKRNHCSLRKHHGAGLGTLPLLAAGAGPALVAVQPPRWPRPAGSFGDSPHQALAHTRDPLLTPKPHAGPGILGCCCPRPPVASMTGRGMHGAIPSLQKHLQGHQLYPRKILQPSLCLPDGSTPLLPLPFPSPGERVPCYGSLPCLAFPSTELGAGFGH